MDASITKRHAEVDSEFYRNVIKNKGVKMKITFASYI